MPALPPVFSRSCESAQGVLYPAPLATWSILATMTHCHHQCSFLIGVSLQVYMLVTVHVYMCIHAWEGEKLTLGGWFSEAIHLLLWDRIFIGLEFTKWAGLADQCDAEICLGLLSKLRDVYTTIPSSFVWALRIQFKFWRLWSKHFTA